MDKKRESSDLGLRWLSESSAALAREVFESFGPPVFQARGITQSKGVVREFHIEVDLQAEAWFLHAVGTDQTIEHSDGFTTSREGALPMEFAGQTPWPLHLAFPANLALWGRAGDDYEPISAEEFGTHSILITAQHVLDPAQRATLVFDRNVGLVHKLIRPTDTNQLDMVKVGVALGRDRSSVPTDLSFRAPEY